MVCALCIPWHYWKRALLTLGLLWLNEGKKINKINNVNKLLVVLFTRQLMSYFVYIVSGKLKVYAKFEAIA